MQAEILGPRLLRDQPATGERNAVYIRGRDIDGLLPFGEIDGAGKWREDDELGEGEIGGVSQCGGGIEGRRLVAGQSEDERTQNVNAVGAEIS